MILRPYQIEDINKLKQFPACACFNQQRTGKTPIALNLIKEHNCKKVIVITTGTTILPWQASYKELLNEDCIAVTGKTKPARIKQINNWKHGLIIAYSTIKTGIIDDILKQKPDMVILDEAHKIKNYSRPTAKTVFKLSKVPYRLALTGTFAQNYEHEVWSILHFLYPHTFRSYWKFIEEFFKTTREKNWQRHTEYTVIGGFKDNATQLRFQKFLDKFSTQRKRKDNMLWLPEPEPDINVFLEPDTIQKEYITQLKNYYEIQNTDVICKGILDRCTRYRQICDSPALINPNLPATYLSPKLQWLNLYFEEYKDTPTIVFTKFIGVFKLIQNTPHFKNLKAGFITGASPLEKRKTIIEDFQKGNITYLFAQVDTCKEGITLDKAEVTIFIDQYPPAADIEQAKDRFIATTPETAGIPKTIYNLIMQETYEEQLYKHIKERFSCTDVLNDFIKYLNKL